MVAEPPAALPVPPALVAALVVVVEVVVLPEAPLLLMFAAPLVLPAIVSIVVVGSTVDVLFGTSTAVSTEPVPVAGVSLPQDAAKRPRARRERVMRFMLFVVLEVWSYS